MIRTQKSSTISTQTQLPNKNKPREHCTSRRYSSMRAHQTVKSHAALAPGRHSFPTSQHQQNTLASPKNYGTQRKISLSHSTYAGKISLETCAGTHRTSTTQQTRGTSSARTKENSKTKFPSNHTRSVITKTSTAQSVIQSKQVTTKEKQCTSSDT